MRIVVWKECLFWVVASAASAGLGVGVAWWMALASFESYYSEQGGGMRVVLGPLGAALFYSVAGFIVGVGQWIVLRRHLSSAGRWILIVIGVGLAFAAFSLVVDGGSTGPAVAVGGAVILGAFGGVLSGPLLVWWLRRRDRGADDVTS